MHPDLSDIFKNYDQSLYGHRDTEFLIKNCMGYALHYPRNHCHSDSHIFDLYHRVFQLEKQIEELKKGDKE